jgi:hypothetical protein
MHRRRVEEWRHNMVFVYRGANDEGSNLLKNNVPPDWIR